MEIQHVCFMSALLVRGSWTQEQWQYYLEEFIYWYAVNFNFINGFVGLLVFFAV